MSFNFLRLFLFLLSSVALFGCSSGGSNTNMNNYAPSGQQGQYGQPQAYSETPYNQRSSGDSYPLVPLGQKIRLKADSIKFISSYNLPTRAPNVDQLMLVFPEQLIHKWAVNRFGVDRTPDRYVRFLIIDASIIEEKIYTGGSMSKSAKHKYNGRFEVSLQITDKEGRVLSETRKAVDSRYFTDSTTVIEQEASLEARERLWIGLTYDLLKQLSIQLEQELSTPAFNEFVVR